MVEGDFVQPCREGVVLVVAFQGIKRFHERFLHEVFGFLTVLDHLIDHIKDAVTISFQEAFICGLIAVQGLLDDLIDVFLEHAISHTGLVLLVNNLTK